jgi:hypothetical protein
MVKGEKVPGDGGKSVGRVGWWWEWRGKSGTQSSGTAALQVDGLRCAYCNRTAEGFEPRPQLPHIHPSPMSSHPILTPARRPRS